MAGPELDFIVFSRFDVPLKMALELLRVVEPATDYKAVSMILESAILAGMKEFTVKYGTRNVRDSFTALYDYISLPSLIILDRLHNHWDVIEQGQQQKIVHQQQSWKAASISCQILLHLFENTSNLEDGKLLKCASMLGKALPHRSQIKSLANSAYLDKGQSVMDPLLRTIQRLGSLLSSKNSLCDLFEGRWFAVLCDSSTTMIDAYPLTDQIVHTALQTLSSLFHVEICSHIQGVFPGVFSTLYRCILQSFKVNTDVAPKAVRALARLIDSSLFQQQQDSHHSGILDGIKGLSSTDKRVTFWDQVKTRVPGPLLILLRTLSVCRSDELKAAAGGLCRSMWKTRSLWSMDMMTALLESVMTLSQSPVPSIQADARNLKESMQKDASFSSQALPDRIQALLVNDLPPLAHGRHSREFQHTCRLLVSYLEWGNLSCRRHLQRFLRDSLPVWKSCIDMLRLEPLSQGKSQLSVVDTSGTKFLRPPEPYIICVDDESRRSLTEVIYKIGEVLGSKRVCLLVDFLICDAIKSAERGREASKTIEEKFCSSLLLSRTLVEGAHVSEGRSHRFLDEFIKSTLPLLISNKSWKRSYDSLHVSGASLASTSPVEEARNSILYCTMDFIVVLIKNSKVSESVICPSILLPFVQIASIHRGCLSEMSLFSLYQIAAHFEYESLTSFLKEHRQLLSSELLGAMRISQTPNSLNRNAVTCSRLIQFSVANHTGGDSSFEEVDFLSGFSNVLSSLIEAFDAESVSENPIDGLVQVSLYEVSLSHMRDWAQSIPSLPSVSNVQLECWQEPLMSFRVINSGCFESSAVVQYEEAESPTNVDYQGLTDLVNQMMTRSCYHLSHPNIFVQVKAATCLPHGFRLLNRIQELFVRNAELNGPKTAILRQVATSWPPILGRLRYCERLLFDSSSIRKDHFQMSITNGVDKDSMYSQYSFLMGYLLETVGTISASSGDFFCGRFVEHVIPLLCKTLNFFMNSEPSHMKESSKRLVLAVFSCLRTSFQDADFVAQVSYHTTKISTFIFPFLNHKDSAIRDACTSTLRVLISLNPDLLLRDLYRLSKTPVEPCPFFVHVSTAGRDCEHSESKSDADMVQQITGDLLQFGKSRSKMQMSKDVSLR